MLLVIVGTLACLGVGFGFITHGGGFNLMALIATPTIWLLYVIFIRITLEAIVAAVKTSENTTKMLEIMQGKHPYQQ